MKKSLPINTESLISMDCGSSRPGFHWISEDATFGPFNIEIEICQSGNAPRIKRVQLTFELKYAANGRSDRFYKHFELARRRGRQVVEVPLQDIRGGDGVMNLIVHLSGVSKPVRGANTVTIRARQPGKENIRSYIGDKNLEVIIYHLSKFQQFDSTGSPIYSDGFGMYRFKQPTSEQIWNWKKHVDAAKVDFAARMETIRQIPANLRSTDPVLYASLPDFTSTQVLIETFQSYGVGAAYKPSRQSEQSRWKWVANAENDGFGAKCVKTKKDVADGNPPADWN